METSIQDFGCTTNIEVVQRFVTLSGRFVIDAGCGAMALSRQLAQHGAQVLAVDPDSVQAESNRKMGPTPNVKFAECGAEKFPVGSGSVDGVFFGYSLHHIPKAIYRTVFDEVFRVLKRDGFLYVIEPTTCPLNEVMKHFHDEDRERADAQEALIEMAAPAFEQCHIAKYHSFTEFESYEDFATQYASRTFNTNYTESDIRRPEVAQAFERLGAPDYCFSAPKQIMYLQGLKE